MLKTIAKWLLIFSCAAPAVAFADVSITINPSIPFVSSGSDIGGVIQGFYLYALAMAGILAFGAIVYGGVRYAVGRGNPSSESEGKSWITSALLGLVLLAGASVILYTINPALVTLGLPDLQNTIPLNNASPLTGPNVSQTSLTYGCVAGNGLYACASTPDDSTCSTAVGCPTGAACNQIPVGECGLSASALGACIPTSGGEGVYNGPGTAGNQSSWSPGLKQVMGCVQPALSGIGSAPWTTNGQHMCYLSTIPPKVSCHFGGTCTDGGHAFDIDVNNNNLSLLQQAKTIAERCGNTTNNTVTCRCESQNGVQLDPSCTQSYDNHVHCNVNNSACGCN